MKWLTGGGLAASLAVGAAVTAGLGWRGLALLLAFFLSGSLLTQWSGGGEGGGGVGGRRNVRQVIANGAVAAVAALGGAWPVAAGALAAATADTWATEIGSHSPTPPRLITSGVPVSHGASGGITPLGTAGGAAGAMAMAALATALFSQAAGPGLATLTGAGVLGMLADSVLGATVQGVFECPGCGARFERVSAVCHEPVRRIRGWTWLDNDGVNLAATLVGAGIAALGWRLAR